MNKTLCTLLLGTSLIAGCQKNVLDTYVEGKPVEVLDKRYVVLSQGVKVDCKVNGLDLHRLYDVQNIPKIVQERLDNGGISNVRFYGKYTSISNLHIIPSEFDAYAMMMSDTLYLF